MLGQLGTILTTPTTPAFYTGVFYLGLHFYLMAKGGKRFVRVKWRSRNGIKGMSMEKGYRPSAC